MDPTDAVVAVIAATRRGDRDAVHGCLRRLGIGRRPGTHRPAVGMANNWHDLPVP